MTRLILAAAAAAALALAASPVAASEIDHGLLRAFRDGSAQAKQRLVAAGADAVAPLAAMLTDKDARVAWAARSALRQVAVAAGKDAGRRKAIYDALLPYLVAERPLAQRRAVAEALGLVGDGTREQVKPLAHVALREPELADDALVAIGRMGDGGVSALTCIVNHDGVHLMLGEDFGGRVTPAVKARALKLIAMRAGEPGSPDQAREMLRFWTNATRHADAFVKAASLRGLGRLGEPKGVPTLVDAIRKRKGAVKAAAFDGLLACAATRLRAKDALTARSLYEQAVELAATDPQRSSALAGLGRVGDPASLPKIQEHLKAKSAAVRHAAYAALCQVRGEAGAEAIAKALREAPKDMQPLLIDALGARADASAVPLLIASARGKDEATARAAIRALDRTNAPGAAEGLREVARKGASAAVEAAALRTALRLAHRRADVGPRQAALLLLLRALKLARADADRAEAIRGLAKVGDPLALAVLRPIVADEKSTYRRNAAVACLAIADAAAARGDREAAIVASAAVADQAPTPALEDEAVKKLHGLGVHHDLAARKGAITTWWLLGPFDCRDMNAAKQPHPVEHEFQPKKTYKAGDRTLRWQLIRSRHPEGHIDLKAMVKPSDRVLVYCYTELAVDAKREVELHFGRDDGLGIFLNGERLYEEHTPHAVDAKDFVVKATLAEGVNRILVKSSQGGGGWGFYVRLTDREGKPLR